MRPPGPEPAGVAVPAPAERLAFAMKLQQYTGPVHAKGVEDTAFYRYNVLTSLNEVGGAPERGAGTPDAFHATTLARWRAHPRSMLATGTHDTKRGEDHRARVAALSEFPDEWRATVSLWMRVNAGHRTVGPGGPAPSRNDEYLFYQALVGAWPAAGVPPRRVPDGLAARLAAFMEKAVREAKVHSSWVNVNDAYERAVQRFVEGVLASDTTPRFLAALAPLIPRLCEAGVVNSLAQLTLKLASPGVADFYQGTESWDLSLVDPDNRRPVDFAERAARLHDLRPFVDEAMAPGAGAPGIDLAAAVAQFLQQWPDGRIKTYVTACGLRLRRQRPGLFLHGDYVPLEADDVGAQHLVAFARREGGDELIAVAPRATRRLRPPDQWLPTGAAVWGISRVLLPAADDEALYRHLLTGEVVKARRISGAPSLLAAEVLRTCPVALLWRQA